MLVQVLDVNDEDQRRELGQGRLEGFKRGGPRAIPNLQGYDCVVVVLGHTGGSLEVERLLRGEVVEDIFVDRSLPCSPHS